MRTWHLIVFIGLVIPPSIVLAELESTLPIAPTLQLRGLSSDEATRVIVILEDAQRRFRAGDLQIFELMAGSYASYEATKVSPRDAFVRVPFKQVWEIEKAPTDDTGWQRYKLAYAPDGLGQSYWSIEVLISGGKLERVHMFYKPPAPF